MDLWTQILQFTSLFVTPVWNELPQYIPLLLVGLTFLAVLGVAWMWQRHAAANRSRVPRPVPAGPMPQGVHLPGPSIWPFIAPIGLFLVAAAVIMGGNGQPNLFLIGAGLAVGVVAALGWLLDARDEYDHLEAGDHHLRLVAETDGVARPVSIPEGIHLPGPSAWPFLAPIGLFFVVAGLIFGPILIVGGLIMATIAAIGWYLDAGREYVQVEAGHAPEPETRDPERAFPKRLMPVYFAVGFLALLLTLSPWLLSLLPSTSSNGGTAEGPPPVTTPYLSASAATSYDQRLIVVKVGTRFTLTFDDKQDGVPHNVSIFDAAGTNVFKGDIITGPATIDYAVQALDAGTYRFVCSVHPPMVGKLIVR